MISEQKIDSAVSNLFDTIEFEKEPRGLYDPLRYMIAIGGKRIRPKLCITAYSLFKDNISDEILQPAAALEVFHTFTLIHDDIMDRSVLRRGKETVWTKWSDDTAILSGDVMLIDSYKRIVNVPSGVHADAMALFSDTAAQVCEGQQLDMDFENLTKVPMADYERMIGLKTAVLLACSAKMGALVGGASARECEALYRYGYQLGMAFQVCDDYLDTFGDEKVFGKPIGGDILNNKKSWLLTRAFEKVRNEAVLLDAMALPMDTDADKRNKIDAVRSIYVDLGVDADAREEINAFTVKAMESLDAIALSNVHRVVLRRFSERLVGRVK